MSSIIEEVCGMLMAVCFMLCNVPQIYKIVKTKSSKDISVYTIIMCMTAYVFGLAHMCLSGHLAFWIILNFLTGMLTTSILFVAYIKYNK